MTSAPGKTLTFVIFAGFFLLALTPLFFVAHPPLQDYPNHLARAFIFAHHSDPVLAQFYAIDWKFVPNLTGDLILWGLMTLFPPALAGKIFVALVLLVLAGGVFCFHRALHGKVSPAVFLLFLVLYNNAFAQGFLNYLLATGLCFFGLALWLRLANNKKAQYAAGLATTLLLLPSHLYALGLFLLFIFCLENRPLWQNFRPHHAAFWRSNIRLLPLVIVPALLFIILSPTAGAGLGAIEFVPVTAKALFPFIGLFYAYDPVLVICLSLILLAAPFVLSTKDSRRSYYFYLGAGLLIYLCLPRVLLSSANADWRFLIPVMFFALAHLDFRKDAREARFFLLAVAGFLVFQQVQTTSFWRAADYIYHDFTTATADLPEGASVFPLVIDPPGYYRGFDVPVSPSHYFSYLVIDKKAFVPSMFTSGRQQILTLRPPYETIQAALLNNQGVVSTRFTPGTDFGWPQKAQDFDYAVIISPVLFPNTPDKLIRQAGSVSLYQLR